MTRSRKLSVDVTARLLEICVERDTRDGQACKYTTPAATITDHQYH